MRALKYVVTLSLVVMVIGVCAGTMSALFLSALDVVSTYRQNHIQIIIWLPFAGLGIGLMFYFFGKRSVGHHQLLQATSDKAFPLNIYNIPLVFFSSIATHLFGGSAGREGVGVQLGGVWGGYLFRKIEKHIAIERSVFIKAGMSAGFASIFGTPLAASVYALEVLRIDGYQRAFYQLIINLFGAYIAHFICLQWGVQHTLFPTLSIPTYHAFFSTLLPSLLLCGLMGLCAVVYHQLNALSSTFFNKISYSYLRPFVGGMMVLFIMILIQDASLLGLSIDKLLLSFGQTVAVQDAALKMVLTIITISSGFKGGEVTPIFCIGAFLGSSASLYIHLPTTFCAAMGLVSLFGGVFKTPYTAIFLAYELWGYECVGWALVFCLITYYMSKVCDAYLNKK